MNSRVQQLTSASAHLRAAAESLPDDVAVSVRNVSKKFCKNLRRSMAYGILDLGKNMLGVRPESSQLRKSEFWALDDVSLELKRGEVLGLIGANGSGKTTLLRMLAGIFPPDKGEIAVRGRVGALISVGAGFHPHMTGRENVYVNGAILGMTRAEIDERFDAIVSFAEIGDFLDAPVSTYSSGMRVRLGFAIAAHVGPDVMLVDEILAVGDRQFRVKCHRHMAQLRGEQKAIILVSHQTDVVRRLCDRVAVLWKGQLARVGPADEAVDWYAHRCDEESMRSGAVDVDSGRNIKTPDGEVLSIKILGDSGEPRDVFQRGESMVIESNVRVSRRIIDPAIYVLLYNVDNIADPAAGFCNRDDAVLSVLEPGENSFRLQVDGLTLKRGRYFVNVCVADANGHRTLAWRRELEFFRIESSGWAPGVAHLPHKWQTGGIE